MNLTIKLKNTDLQSNGPGLVTAMIIQSKHKVYINRNGLHGYLLSSEETLDI